MTKNQLEKIGKLAVIKKWFPDTLFRPPWQQKIMRSKLVAGATIALGLTVTAKIVEEILQYLKEQKLKAKSSTYYAKMLEAHPELKKEKPETVARYWASLYHFAPYMAQDPLAAGAFIRQSLARGLPEEFGGPAPDTYSTLAAINESILKAKGQIRPGELGVAARTTFGTQVIKNYMGIQSS